MNHHYNRPPMTPKFNKRIAPATPVASATKSNNKAPRRTKHQMTPRSLLSPRRCTPTTNIGTPDRFIPNRARTDVAKARHALLTNEPKSENDSNDNDSQREYQQRLRQALWGQPDNEGSLLMFGANDTPQTPQRGVDSPYRLDILRSPSFVTPKAATPDRRRKNAAIDQVFALEATDILEEEDLDLISYGPWLAVALNDKLFLWKKGNTQVLMHQPGDMISSVRWSQNGKLLAVGLEDSVQIWCPEEDRLVKEFFHIGGFVTALAWYGVQLLAATGTGIIRYDLEKKNAPPICYEGHGEDRAASVVFNETTMASAGGGIIKVWDTNQRRGQQPIPAKRSMQHSGVRTIQFCPDRPNVLVSGGDNGIKLWNAQSGALRSTIDMEGRVNAMVWSPFTNSEILVAQEKRMSLWSIGLKATKLVESETGAGKITSMDCSSDGQVACAHVDETVSGYSVFREFQKEKRNGLVAGTGGTLAMPIIR